jgi:hypothetical protein
MKLAPREYSRGITLLFIAVCVHAVFCLSLRYHFLDPLFYITTHSKGQGGPFFGVYQAGVNLMHGESIYGSDNYSSPTHVVVPYYHFYRYLPFVSYLSGILSKVVKPWPAYWGWVLMNEILLAVCIVLTLRLRKTFGAVAVAVAAFWLLYSPMYVELYMGQFCLTMTFFIFLILYPFMRRPAHASDAPVPSPSPRAHHRLARTIRVPAWLSSVPWIATVLIKSFTILYAPTFVRLGKKRLALTGVSAAVITSAPYFFIHRQDLRWFFHLNLQPLPPRLIGGCFGFTGLARNFFNSTMPFLGTNMIRMGSFDIFPRNIPLMALAAAIIFTTFYITVRQKKLDPVGNITLWTLTFFLVFKDIWEYHYVILIPLFIALYLETRSKYLLVLFIVLAIPTPFVFYDIPASEDPQLFWSTPLSLMHHSFKAVPTFLFYIWVVRREWRRMSPARAPQPTGV